MHLWTFQTGLLRCSLGAIINITKCQCITFTESSSYLSQRNAVTTMLHGTCSFCGLPTVYIICFWGTTARGEDRMGGRLSNIHPQRGWLTLCKHGPEAQYAPTLRTAFQLSVTEGLARKFWGIWRGIKVCILMPQIQFSIFKSIWDFESNPCPHPCVLL